MTGQIKKVAFVGNYNYNFGSSNTFLGHYKAGLKCGYKEIVSDIPKKKRIIIDPYVKYLPPINLNNDFNYLN